MFGDGCISEIKSGNHLLTFSSTNQSLIEMKSKLLNSNVKTRPQHESAWGKKLLYLTSKVVLPNNLNKLEQISNLSLEDLFLWILDDGSYHRSKHFINLCSHALTLAENIELSFHLWHSLGIESRILPEKKKDGRLFWYQYIPSAQVDSLKSEMLLFMQSYNIYGLEYKIGMLPETNESLTK
jgi:hypothetical protein